ncbi:hypothetical protein QQF64_009626 [Cirrhinus molitorella]|uniref:Reverse transcriptase RNase H-like domain-containing protein n=1 Tax=Cirrhinus molitorella TaxID=172907 RepID=A0ABR3M542_9TELE
MQRHVVIHSEAWEDHLDKLRRVLSELRRAGLTANPRKRSSSSLGGQVPGIPSGKRTGPTTRGEDLSHPEGTKTYHKNPGTSFLGVGGILPMFHPQLFLYSCPPDRPDQEGATGEDMGLGAVLSQIQEGKEHLVIYISRKLTQTERKYAAVEKEALAIKWAVLELRYYLFGRKFIGGGDNTWETPGDRHTGPISHGCSQSPRPIKETLKDPVSELQLHYMDAYLFLRFLQTTRRDCWARGGSTDTATWRGKKRRTQREHQSTEHVTYLYSFTCLFVK